AVVEVERGERRQFEKRRAGIDQEIDPFADGKLALFAMPFEIFRSTALACALHAFLHLGDELAETIAIGYEDGIRRVDSRLEDVHHHPQQSVLNPHAGHRQTACMRYISTPQRSHSILSVSEACVLRGGV